VRKPRQASPTVPISFWVFWVFLDLCEVILIDCGERVRTCSCSHAPSRLSPVSCGRRWHRLVHLVPLGCLPLDRPLPNRPPLNRPPLNRPPSNCLPIDRPPPSHMPPSRPPVSHPPTNRPPRNCPPPSCPLLSRPQPFRPLPRHAPAHSLALLLPRGHGTQEIQEEPAYVYVACAIWRASALNLRLQSTAVC
jgi:hypothetical protein